MNLGLFAEVTFFASPYFDHDAFMQHALHIHYAPGWKLLRIGAPLSSVLEEVL